MVYQQTRKMRKSTWDIDAGYATDTISSHILTYKYNERL